jgi:hypothetical protein
LVLSPSTWEIQWHFSWVNIESLEVKNVDTGYFCVKFHLRSKAGRWFRVVAQEINKPPFLAELVRVCENETLPILVGGDFNIIIGPQEKKIKL